MSRSVIEQAADRASLRVSAKVMTVCPQLVARMHRRPSCCRPSSRAFQPRCSSLCMLVVIRVPTKKGAPARPLLRPLRKGVQNSTWPTPHTGARSKHRFCTKGRRPSFAVSQEAGSLTLARHFKLSPQAYHISPPLPMWVMPGGHLTTTGNMVRFPLASAPVRILAFGSCPTKDNSGRGFFSFLT